jgi:hypothetical protein
MWQYAGTAGNVMLNKPGAAGADAEQNYAMGISPGALARRMVDQRTETGRDAVLAFNNERFPAARVLNARQPGRPSPGRLGNVMLNKPGAAGADAEQNYAMGISPGALARRWGAHR